YGLTDPALQRLAAIVRGADTADKDAAPEARGLEAVARGYRLLYTGDHTQLAAESRVYDALYAYCPQITRGWSSRHTSTASPGAASDSCARPSWYGWSRRTGRTGQACATAPPRRCARSPAGWTSHHPPCNPRRPARDRAAARALPLGAAPLLPAGRWAARARL